MKSIAVAGIRRVVYVLPAVDEQAPIIAKEAGIVCDEIKFGCEVCEHRIGPVHDIFNWGCDRGSEASYFKEECIWFKFDETMTVGWTPKEEIHEDMPLCCLAVADEYLDDHGFPNDDSPRAAIFGCGVCGRAWGRDEELVEKWYNSLPVGEREWPLPEEISWWGEIRD
jgi:hypothetical protein